MDLNDMSLKFKLYGLAAILLAFMFLSITVSIIKMDNISDEIVDIAEQDIPLTAHVTNVTINQLYI